MRHHLSPQFSFGEGHYSLLTPHQGKWGRFRYWFTNVIYSSPTLRLNWLFLFPVTVVPATPEAVRGQNSVDQNTHMHTTASDHQVEHHLTVSARLLGNRTVRQRWFLDGAALWPETCPCPSAICIRTVATVTKQHTSQSACRNKTHWLEELSSVCVSIATRSNSHAWQLKFYRSSNAATILQRRFLTDLGCSTQLSGMRII